MSDAVVSFLLQAVVISLSGVMAPGPITAATLAAGARRRHAGAWIAVGHAVVEFPLMGLVVLGAGTFLAARSFRIGVGLAGGACLLLLGLLTLAALRRRPQAAGAADPPRQQASPLWTGIILTGGNPYFLLWWATVGLALASRASELGALAFILFATIHWLCDLGWLEALSVAANKGVGLLGPAVQRLILVVCGLAMGAFGVRFILDASRMLRT